MNIENQSVIAYEGIEFNNRLEATWAAFFDLAGWRWKYQPAMIRAWQPTFLLQASGAPEFVVPVSVDEYAHPLSEQAQLSIYGDVVHDILLLGDSPLHHAKDFTGMRLGWIRDVSYLAEEANWFEECAFHSLGGIGFHGHHGGWTNRITGEYRGDNGSFDPPHDLDAMWARAQHNAGMVL